MRDVQCYELFGGIAHKNHAFSFFFSCRKLHHASTIAAHDYISTSAEFVASMVIIMHKIIYFSQMKVGANSLLFKQT